MKGFARGKRQFEAIAIGAALLAATACGIALWSATLRTPTDLAGQAAHAYTAGDWGAAAKLARQALAVRKEDPITLRLLARASARLGRDTAAMTIYQRSSTKRNSRRKIISCWASCTSVRGRPTRGRGPGKRSLRPARSRPKCSTNSLATM